MNVVVALERADKPTGYAAPQGGERDALDALRYRWLRRAGDVSITHLVDCPGDGNVSMIYDLPPFQAEAKTLDAAIDAAMQAEQPGERNG